MQSENIADFGGIQWELFGLMFITWVIVYFALWKGITNARKVGIFSWSEESCGGRGVPYGCKSFNKTLDPLIHYRRIKVPTKFRMVAIEKIS